MKRIVFALILVTTACGKSDSKKSDEPATDRAEGSDHHGKGKMSDEQRHQRLVDMRAKLDTNGDGKVTPDELAAGRLKFDDPAALDTNHDGDISVEEIEAGMKAGMKARHDKRMQEKAAGGDTAGSAN